MNKKLETIINKYVWGPVITVHTIGIYDIVEHHPSIIEDGRGTGKYDHKKSQFHPYIDGNDTCHGYDTLEEAIVGAIAQKFDGLNSQAAYYFSKMIGIGGI